MSGKHKARSWVRSGVALLAVAGAAGAALVAGSVAANAGTVPNSYCAARVLGADGPTPINVGSFASSPCTSTNQSVASATVTVVPGLLGLGATKATVSLVQTQSAAGCNSTGVCAVSSQADAARLSITGPGLNIGASALHADASSACNGLGGSVSNGNSWIGSLTINGKVIQVAKNVPLTIPIGLRTVVYINRTIHNASSEQHTLLYVSFPDHRYDLAVAQATTAIYCPPLT